MTSPRIQPMQARRGQHRHLASTADICRTCGVCLSLCGVLMDRAATERAYVTGVWKSDCKTCASLI